MACHVMMTYIFRAEKLLVLLSHFTHICMASDGETTLLQ